MSDDRSAPQALETEQAILGALLSDPSAQAVDTVLDLLQPDDFYRPDHQRLFALLVGMISRGEPVTVVTMSARLCGLPGKEIDAYGGLSYVLRLPDLSPPSTANMAYYCGILKEAAIRRKLIRRLADWRETVYDAAPLQPALEVRDRIVGDLLAISNGQTGGWVRYERVGAILEAEVDDASQKIRDGLRVDRGVTSGFSNVDEAFGRFLPGTLTVLGARPAMGKTAIALDVAERVAQDGHEVGIFSLEMTSAELMARSVAKRSGVTARRILEGKIGGMEAHVYDAITQSRDLPIFVDDRAGVSCGELRARVRGLVAGCKSLGLIVVDYVQLMVGSNPREPREAQVSEASRTLKEIAKEFQLPVLALAQLNREVHNRKDPRPMLSDLRESGAIEQDADRVFFLHRPAYYAQGDTRVPKEQAELICAKNRQGATGIADLFWEAERTTFRDASLSEQLRFGVAGR